MKKFKYKVLLKIRKVNEDFLISRQLHLNIVKFLPRLGNVSGLIWNNRQTLWFLQAAF